MLKQGMDFASNKEFAAYLEEQRTILAGHCRKQEPLADFDLFIVDYADITTAKQYLLTEIASLKAQIADLQKRVP